MAIAANGGELSKREWLRVRNRSAPGRHSAPRPDRSLRSVRREIVPIAVRPGPSRDNLEEGFHPDCRRDRNDAGEISVAVPPRELQTSMEECRTIVKQSCQRWRRLSGELKANQLTAHALRQMLRRRKGHTYPAARRGRRILRPRQLSGELMFLTAGAIPIGCRGSFPDQRRFALAPIG
jgi:hypothetical protein